MTPLNGLLVGLGIVLNVGAQICLKLAAGPHGLKLSDLVQRWASFAFNPLLLLGLALYGASVVNWLVVLSRMPLSVAYPLMSLGYVATFLVGVLCFREPWSWVNLLGLAFLLVGVGLIARQVQPQG
jgi:multidrug transporter EmrE-like cation transporter